MQRVLAAFRIVLAAASLAGIVVQLVLSVQASFGIVDFFSYFTILGNLFASVVFVVAAVRSLRGVPSTPGWELTRGAAVVYIAFVGVVFNTLLVGADLGELRPWINVVHHMVMPVAVVLDWLVDPPRYRIPVWAVPAALTVPAVYTAYTLVRGSVTGFTPYPFFDPDAVGGYGAVALYCAGLLVGFLVLAALTRWAGNALGRRAAVRRGASRTL